MYGSVPRWAYLLTLILVAAGLAIATLPPSAASAASAQLDVEARPALSLMEEAVALTVKGTASAALSEARLVVRVGGPAEPSQVGQADPDLPLAATLSQSLTIRPGAWTATVLIPADKFAEPGAYLLDVRAMFGGTTYEEGSLWVGKAVRPAKPLDVAFVWPISLGVHRDPTGDFFDQVLEGAVRPTSENPDSLRSLFELAERFPDWQFTLAVEPILLTQLRDMADGFTRVDASGTRIQIGPDDPSAKNAAQTLTGLKNSVAKESVEIAAGPYAGPALSVLAAEGWRDGLEQLQLGKEELQQTLGLGAPPSGAFTPDLDFTTASLASYGQASIDHVVLDDRLAANLAEQVADGTVAVRARDKANDRVTLVFADSRLSSLMAPPWEAGVFFAGLAAELASGPRDALVIAPGADFAVPPAAYVETIAEALKGLDWMNSVTLTGLLQAHTPSSRPVLFNRDFTGSSGYIENSLLASVHAAHAAVADLATAADPVQAPLENATRLLYTAESRWWWRPQISPQVASVGLAYADQARVLAQNELAKVHFVGAGPTTFWGRRGVIELAAENKGDYPLKVELSLTGAGLVLPQGDRVEVELQPGRNEVPVPVVTSRGAHSIDASLVAGNSVLDRLEHSVRFITIWSLVPWIAAAVVVIAGGTFLTVRRRRSRRRRRADRKRGAGTATA